MTQAPAGRPHRAALGVRAALAAVTLLLAPLVALVLLGVTAGSAYAGPPTFAPAAGGTSPAVQPAAAGDASGLALGSVSPAVVGPGQPVTVTGTLTAQVALTDPVVRVVASSTSIVSRADVAGWATSTAFLGGTEVGRTQVGSPVAAGQAVPFTVTVPAGRLSLSRLWGVIPIAVQVRDTASGASQVLRTFVGWQRRAEYQPLSVSVVAPVTLSPEAALFDTDQARRTAAWQAELAPTGRIAHLLDGTDVDGPGGPVPVTWAVDPAVLGTARGGTLSAADPIAPVVSPLVTRLSAAVGRHTLWALPYADTDLAATVGSNPSDPTVRAQVTAGAGLGQALGVPVETGVAWPTDGGLGAGREAGLRDAYQGVGLDSAVVSSSALPVTSGFSGQAGRRSPDGLPLLAWDDELSRLAARTTSAADGALAAQQLVAESVTLLGESPGVARSFLIALPRGTDPDPAALRGLLSTLATTPWVRVVGSDQLRATAAAAQPVASTTTGSWTAAGAPQVGAPGLARIAKEQNTVEEVSTILGAGGPALRDQWSTMLDQLTSTRWRSAPAQLRQLEDQVVQATSKATSGIHVADQTVNFLADEGTLQVTIVNDLAVPVQGVRLLLGPTNPRLVIPEQPEPVTIAAGSKAVVQVRARAVSAGLVPVNTALTTLDGTVIGASSSILVRANPPGTMLYVVSGIVVGLILLLGIVRALRRPLKARRARSGGTPPPEPGTGPAAPAGREQPTPRASEAATEPGTEQAPSQPAEPADGPSRAVAPPPVPSDRTVG